jgi:hypothetical protein
LVEDGARGFRAKTQRRKDAKTLRKMAREWVDHERLELHERGEAGCQSRAGCWRGRVVGEGGLLERAGCWGGRVVGR